MPISLSCPIDVPADVVECDIPFLFGLDLMKRLATILDFGKWQLTSKLDGWSVPIVEKYGHAYIEWPTPILYTESELRRVHRYFNHPEPHRIYAVMKRGASEKTYLSDLSTLEKITSSCDVYKRIADAPRRFRVSLSKET